MWILWRWRDHDPIIFFSAYAENVSMQSSFVISSLSHISIELSGTDMRDRLEQTSAYTCTHMYKHTQADGHAHSENLKIKQKKQKNNREK